MRERGRAPPPPLPQLALAANPCAHGQSRSSPSAAARGAHRRSPSRGARGALSRLCALHHHGPGAARRARRAEARASAHPLRHAHPQARSRHRLQEMRQDRRRRDGLVPSARRPGDLRGAGAPRPGFFLALSPHRGAGQFRQHRRRQRRRLSLHRGAHDRRRAPAARGRRRGSGRLARQLLRRREGAGRPARGDPQPARQRRAGHRGRHGDLDPAAQRRRALRRRALSHRPSQGGVAGAADLRAGAGFPDRRHRRRRSRGDRRDLSHRARLVPPARALDEGGDRARRLGRRRHRNPLWRAEVAPDRAARQSAQRAQGASARRRARRVDRGRAHRAGAAQRAPSSRRC